MSYKYYLLLLISILLVSPSFAQKDIDEQHSDSKINIQFYHIDINISLDTTLIAGNVLIEYAAEMESLESFELDLHNNFKVSAIDGAKKFEQKDGKLLITLDKALAKNEKASLKISYAGIAPNEKSKEGEGVMRGLVRGTHGKKKNPVIATVCFPDGASLWFPCKETGYDKADSLYVDITIEDRKVEEIFLDPRSNKEVSAEIPVIAVSNGDLKSIESNDGKKTFKWRHIHRIAPHHVMIAISDYMKIEKEFVDKTGSYPIDFYIFPEKFKQSNAMFNRAPEIMSCLTNTFGAYPYKNERLSITMTGIPLGLDGMPTQTNVMLEDMKSTHMYKLVHQAASMWFGNHISPASWQDAWITEALAAYAEAMWQEYKRGLNVYQIILDEKEYFKGGKLYMDNKEEYSKERFNKKGMYVMHMLRGIMGDSYFFESLKSITSRKKIRGKFSRTYLSTKRFKEICEYYASENYDVDYEYFFNEWVYGEMYPTLRVKYRTEKGKLVINIQQDEQATTPQLFRMPVRIELVKNDGKIIKDNIDFKLANEDAVLDYGDIEEVRFDPSNWIFKDLKYVCKVTNSKMGLENFDIKTSNHRRKAEVSFNSPKKQDITIELIQLADGVMLTEDKVLSTQPIKKHQGEFKQSFKIPLSYSQRGAYKLVVKSKGETYTKQLRLKRIKDLL